MVLDMRSCRSRVECCRIALQDLLGAMRRHINMLVISRRIGDEPSQFKALVQSWCCSHDMLRSHMLDSGPCVVLILVAPVRDSMAAVVDVQACEGSAISDADVDQSSL